MTVTCPNCTRGRIRRFICYSAYPGADGKRTPIYFDVLCPLCGGTGTLKGKKALRYQEEKRV